jgi:branched-chain amino acid transport system permease protein
LTVFLQQLINGLSLGAIYALIALGYTMVYGTLQLINFAHGEVYMVGAFAALYIARWTGVVDNPTIPGVALVLLGSMIFCAALGMTIERLAYRPLRKSTRLNILITAIGVSLLLQNLGLLLFGPIDTFPTIVPETQWEPMAGLVIRSNDLITLGVTLTLMLGLRHIVEKTQMGRAMRAVSHSRDTAAMMGIPVDRVISFTFALGSVLAAAAAFLVAMDKHVIKPDMGAMGGLKAFVAAVLGGIGSIPGAVLGGFMLGISETLVSGYLASTYRDAIAFGILIVVLLVRPAGLLGRHTVEKV